MKPSNHSMISFMIAFSATISACHGGGSTTPQPNPGLPVITAVEPTGVVGSAGGWTRFHAEVTNDPTSWQWDFTGGASTADVTADPRVRFSTAGPITGSVQGTNSEGTSEPFPFSFQVTDAPIPPTWQAAAAQNALRLRRPAVLITDQAVLIYSRIDDLSLRLPTISTVDRTRVQDPAAWVTYSNEDFTDRPLPRHGNAAVEIREHDGRIYLLGHGGVSTAIAWTDETFPDSLDDWTYSDFHPDPSTVEGREGRLTFVNGKPCIIATTGYSLLPFGLDEFVFAFWAGLAETPTPSATSDWTIVRLEEPDLIQDENYDIRYEATETPGGGVAIVTWDTDDRLAYHFAADEAAIRASALQSDNIGAPSLGSGIPFEMITHGQEMIVAFHPLNGAPGDLGLAVSGDPTGLVANWKMRRIPGIAPALDLTQSRQDNASPMVVWGNRLVLLSSDPEGVSLARELTPGASTAAGWDVQRIAGAEVAGAVPTIVHASLATSGLDCYVAASLLYGTESLPLWLMSAEGSW